MHFGVVLKHQSLSETVDDSCTVPAEAVLFGRSAFVGWDFGPFDRDGAEEQVAELSRNVLGGMAGSDGW